MTMMAPSNDELSIAYLRLAAEAHAHPPRSTHCRAFCRRCITHCGLQRDHTDIHAHDPALVWASICQGTEWRMPRLCKSCEEREVLGDWAICRVCAIAIEMRGVTDLREALDLLSELLAHIYPPRDLLPPPP